MSKIVGITGSGMIGRNPWDPHCWSYIGYNLFTTLRDMGCLRNAFGVEASKFEYYFAAATNFSLDGALWRKKFYLDIFYYEALTRAVKRKLIALDLGPSGSDHAYLQLGAIYDVPSLVDGQARCFSYHDGNVAQMMTSPNFPPQLMKYAERAYEWEKSVYGRMDKILTMSEYLRQSFIEDFGIPPEKVANVGVGANFEIPEINPNKDHRKKGILYIGIDYKRKGLSNLVSAFRVLHQKYPDATLHIIGPREVPNFIVDGLEGVRFHGFLSRTNKEERVKFMSIIDECTLFVLPSLYEPFGVAVLEAMACGMAAIATNKWAFPEMITPGHSGDLVEHNSVDDLIEKIEMYLSDDDLRTSHGENARNDVIEKVGWEKVVSRIMTEINTNV